jgi:hypothetical protein
MNVGMSNSVTTAIRDSIRNTAIGRIRNHDKADRATVELSAKCYLFCPVPFGAADVCLQSCIIVMYHSIIPFNRAVIPFKMRLLCQKVFSCTAQARSQTKSLRICFSAFHILFCLVLHIFGTRLIPSYMI